LTSILNLAFGRIKTRNNFFLTLAREIGGAQGQILTLDPEY